MNTPVCMPFKNHSTIHQNERTGVFKINVTTVLKTIITAINKIRII